MISAGSSRLTGPALDVGGTGVNQDLSSIAKIGNSNSSEALQGLARRKNCWLPEMIFVTVYCPLTTTGALETLAQTIGEPRFVVDCKVNPPFVVVGHVKIIELGA